MCALPRASSAGRRESQTSQNDICPTRQGCAPRPPAISIHLLSTCNIIPLMSSGAADNGPGGHDGLRGVRRFFDAIGTFWQRVTEGLEIQVLWSQFTSEARASYSLYTREVDWDAFRHERRMRRFLKISRALFWAMLMKLSPARRVFLLIALALAVLALTATATVQAGKTTVAVPNNFLYVVLAVGALVFLLALELADRVTMKRDLEIAREIQHWLVPSVPPQVPGAEIAFTSRPANTVGGDYYDAFLMDSADGEPRQRLMMVVADVAGKSVPAALLMATFQASLRSLTTTSIPLAALVEGMNRYASAHSLGGRRYTTAFFAELDPETRALSYISAGHNPPLLRRASGRIERLEVTNLPLGIKPGLEFATGSATLGAGDVLLIFTDGLVESMTAAEDEFGEERVTAWLKSAPVASAEAMLVSLLSTVDGFTGGARQHDDLTCLFLRVS
jgi:sigma-B regulation protein RsbU (phosphoserine phosphatase)